MSSTRKKTFLENDLFSVLDLSKRSNSKFTFPVEQVQTVYRLLVRAEPAMLERLCMAITESEGGSIDDKTDDERENMSNWYNKRKDETSKVLVYNSYIYPTLGMTKKFPNLLYFTDHIVHCEFALSYLLINFEHMTKYAI